jgi:hypothetical protein
LGAFEFQDRNPCHCKSGHDPPGAEIFHENAGLQQKTVNTGFPAHWDGEKCPPNPPFAQARQFD